MGPEGICSCMFSPAVHNAGHAISHSSSVTVTVWIDPWVKKTPTFGIAYLGPSLGKLPNCFFIYWKWLKNISEVSFMSCALTEVSVKGRKLHVRESARPLVAAGGCSFLDWCRNSRVRRRKKIYKAESQHSLAWKDLGVLGAKQKKTQHL